MAKKPKNTKKSTTTKRRPLLRRSSEPQTADGIYFLKLVMYLILGSLWVKITDGDSIQLPLPVGMLLGLVFAAHDKVQLDRKIGFAILLIAMLVGFWAPFGIYIAI